MSWPSHIVSTTEAAFIFKQNDNSCVRGTSQNFEAKSQKQPLRWLQQATNKLNILNCSQINFHKVFWRFYSLICESVRFLDQIALLEYTKAFLGVTHNSKFLDICTQLIKKFSIKFDVRQCFQTVLITFLQICSMYLHDILNQCFIHPHHMYLWQFHEKIHMWWHNREWHRWWKMT